MEIARTTLVPNQNKATKALGAATIIGAGITGATKYAKNMNWAKDIIKNHSLERDGIKRVKLDPAYVPTVDEFIKSMKSQSLKQAAKYAGVALGIGATVTLMTKLLSQRIQKENK